MRYATTNSTVLAPSGVRAVLHWVLTLVLLVDLVGWPVHAHDHHRGLDSVGEHLVSSVASLEAASAPHFDSLDDRASSFEPLALRPWTSQVGKWHPVIHQILRAVVAVDGSPPLTLGDASWSTLSEQVPLLHSLHLRPDGRAPPLLHI